MNSDHRLIGPVYLSVNKLKVDDLLSDFYDRAEVIVFKNRFDATEDILTKDEKEVLANVLVRRAQVLSEKGKLPKIGTPFADFLDKGFECKI
ncbi:hypothetical protein Saci_0681 [Sulfolobus acidocaldarius DSM 639]|uniref:Uncharacterized protein n=1 Tax=Sulfolobus acidocaldarius (strain ATCC 33909 / DSM 639 / JCM 8929 / NBRC 15157 / NCIMB 11770) TaxID=330779 RepID=Q4JAW6_SULAC|nr:hypothetical protein Saci_0681 [Sulfolobus acidocaldarius DSM 639]